MRYFSRKKLFIGIISFLSILCIACMYFMGCFGNHSFINLKENKHYAGIDVSTATAADIVNDINVGYNLGNTFDATQSTVRDTAVKHSANEGTDYETTWEMPETTKEMITMIKNKGFNAIRIPVTWNHHLIDDGNGNITISKPFINRVKEVVNYAYDQGMYVIINSHHDTADYSRGKADTYAKDQTGLTWTMGVPYMLFNCETDNASQCLNVKRLWTALANEFKDYDNHLIFEDFNEILGTNRNDWSGNQTQWTNLNNLQQAFVDAVRATGGKNSGRILSLCSSYGNGANHVDSMKCFNIKDTAKNKIIIQAHFYKKYQGPLSEGTLQKLKTYFIDKGYPVIIGETGYDVVKNSEDENVKSAVSQMKLTKKYGIKEFYWDGGEFSILDRKNLKWKSEKLVDAITNFDQNSSNVTYNPAEKIITTGGTLDTGIPINSSYKTEMKMAFDANDKYGIVLGRDGDIFQVRQEGGKIRAVYGSNRNDIADVTKGNVITISTDDGSFSIDGNKLKEYTKITPKKSDDTMLVSQGNVKIDVYYLKVWDSSGKLIGDFVPVYDNYGIGALKDNVTGKVIYASGNTGYTPSAGGSTETKISPETVTLNKTSETLDLNGTKTLQLQATIAPANANTNKNLTWTTSNKDVATVSATGLVTGIKEGKATIKVATENGKEATCEVTVTKSVIKISPEKVTLNTTSETLDLNGTKTLQLQATITPANANTNKNLTWTTSNKDVATVSTTGLVTGIKEGKATIKVATENGKEATCEVTVKKSEKNTDEQGKDSKELNLKTEYSIVEKNGKKVIATITSESELQELDGWTLSSDKHKLMKEFSNNVDQLITVKDTAGNSKQVNIKIDNFDEKDNNANVNKATNSINTTDKSTNNILTNTHATQGDNTQATGILPKTGGSYWIVFSIIIASITGLIGYIKLRKSKDIK